MDLASLRSLLNEPFTVLSDDIQKLQKLVSYYRKVFDVDICSGCGGNEKYYQYYLKLKNEGLAIMENKEKSDFLLKNGVTGVPMEFGSSRYLTSANLTDELAIEFLSKNKKRIALFEKFPKDWETRVATEKTTDKKAAKVKAENPVEETEEVATKAEAKTKEKSATKNK